MQCTIRWANPSTSSASTERAMGCILTAKEAETTRFLPGGFYFDTNRHPCAIFGAIEAEGFELTDILSIGFDNND